MDFGQVIQKALNGHRNYCQSRLRIMLYEYAKNHDNTFPSLRDMAQLATRDIPLETEDKREHDCLSELFVFYADQLLPIVAGNIFWRP